MVHMSKKFQKYITIVNLFILLAVICVPVYSINTVADTKNEAKKSINLPESVCRQVESFRGNTNRTIYLIQDCHTDPDAQFNIAKIIDYFVRNKGINLVCLEGASKEIDTSFYDQFPDIEAKKRVAEFFVKKGYFTGSEFFKIANNLKNVTVTGVEKRNIYFDDLKYYKNLESYSDLVNILADIENDLHSIKSEFFPKDLGSFDKIREQYNLDKIDLSIYLNFIKKYADKTAIRLSDYPNLEIFFDLTKYESKCENKKIELQRADLVKELSNKLNQNDLNKLINNNIRFSQKKISEQDYYLYLNGVINTARIDLNKYPELKLKLKISCDSDNLDFSIVADEIEQIEYDICARLAGNESALRIIKGLHSSKLLKEAFRMNLTHRQLQVLNNDPQLWNIQNTIDFLNSRNIVKKYNLSDFDRAMENTRRFYELALERDKILLDNTLNKNDCDSSSDAILIAGGFHTRGITSLLREKNISYSVIQPKVSLNTKNSFYTSKLTGDLPEVSQLAEFFSSKINAPIVTGDTALDQIKVYANIAFYILYESAVDALPSPAPLNDAEIQKIMHYAMEELETKNSFGLDTVKELVRTVLRNRERDSIAETLMTFLADKDPYTADHCRRVSRLAEMIGEEMRLPLSQRENLRYAGLLHDFGKLLMPVDILTSTARLTDAQYLIVKRHSIEGEDIIKKYSYFKDVLPGIRNHHEHLNGTGYPDGLTGENIPLMARIVSVADAYDAITSDRPYHISDSVNFAIREIQSDAGSQFDPVVVEAFVKCYEKHRNIPGSMFFEETEISNAKHDDEFDRSQLTISAAYTFNFDHEDFLGEVKRRSDRISAQVYSQEQEDQKKKADTAISNAFRAYSLIDSSM